MAPTHPAEETPKKAVGKRPKGAITEKRHRHTRKTTALFMRQGAFIRQIMKNDERFKGYTGITKGAMNVAEGLLAETIHMLPGPMTSFVQNKGRATLGMEALSAAVYSVFPPELGKHAMARAAEAVSSYDEAIKASA